MARRRRRMGGWSPLVCAWFPGHRRCRPRRYGGVMEHVRWTARPELHEPVVIAAFEGWNDAGDAATTAARYLVERWDAELVAEVDPEEFYDFSSTRPQVHLDDDGQREIVWPATEVFAGSIPGVGTDVLIVVGTEPQLRWRTYCARAGRDRHARTVPGCASPSARCSPRCPTPGPRRSWAPPTTPDIVAGVELQPSTLRGAHRHRRACCTTRWRGRAAHGVAVGHRAVLRARARRRRRPRSR